MNAARQEQQRSRLMTASDWLQRMDRDDIPEAELQAWLEWCSESEENRQAFEEMQALYQGLREAPESDKRRLREAAGAVPPRRSAAMRLGWPLALAAGVAAVAIVLFVWREARFDGPVVFVTARGEHRSVSLPDGSRLVLGAQSDVQVNYSAGQRLLSVRAGEAYFEVARDAQRPFVVQAGLVRVTALGTAFDVQRSRERVAIAVAEGTVEVRREPSAAYAGSDPAHRPIKDQTLRLKPGQRTVIAAAASPAQPLTAMPVDSGVVTAWREGQLEFVNEPLSVVIESVNRYARREVILGDEGVGRLTYTGTVMQGRADEWIDNLPQVFVLRSRVLEDGTVILSVREN